MRRRFTYPGWFINAVVAIATFLVLTMLAFLQECHSQPIDALRFVGDARDSSGVVILTPARRASRGAVWTTKRHPVAGGFTASFSFRILDTAGAADPSGRSGGDGFAFVIQDDNNAALGGLGFGLGYGWNERDPGIARSLAVEFDFWDDTALPFVPSFVDFAPWHVAVHAANVPSEQNGAVQAYTRAVNTIIPRTDDGQWHRVAIRYAPPWLDIWLDSVRVLSWKGNLDTVIGSDDAYIGLTAATMSAWEQHQITDIQIAPVGSDTVRWNQCIPDTVLLRDTTTIRDTIRITEVDTLIIEQRDTVILREIQRDTVVLFNPSDTITIIRTDTLRRYDTCYITHDTCWSALDTVCGGSLRGMIPQTVVYGLEVIPNPVDNLCILRVTLGDRGRWVVRILTIGGEEVWSAGGIAATEGVIDLAVDVSGWPRDLYLVQLIGRGGGAEALMSVKR